MMAPLKLTKIRTYFKFDREIGVSVCLVNKDDDFKLNDGIVTNDEDPMRCGKQLKGDKASNLKSHLRKKHRKIFDRYSKLVVESVNAKHEAAEDRKNEQKSNTLSNYFIKKPKETCTITITKTMMLKSLLAKVTLDGRPFVSLEDMSYSIFSKPAMNALNLSYNRNNIDELIESAAIFIRTKIQNSIKNSLISIKVDCVTRINRSFLGINTQVMKEGKMEVYVLAVKEITNKHTSENLKTMILQELQNYGISIKNICTITSDNGANLVKAVKLIKEQQQEDPIPNDTDLELDDQQDEYFQDIINNVQWDPNLNDMSIRCAAHVLQLCVQDTLKNSWSEQVMDGYLEVIKQARKVVKELRTQNTIILLKQANLNIPPLDTPTRWGSTYIMLKSLIQLRSFCDECVLHGNTKMKLCDNAWKTIEDVCLSLEPAYKATKKLQSYNITLSDIYKIINICHMRTAEIGSAFSNELVTNLIKRRDTVMEHPAMLSCIYLDPRFSFELDEAQRNIAVKYLQKIYDRILASEESADLISSETDSTSAASGMMSEDEDEIYEKVLSRKHRELKRSAEKYPSFDAALLSFQQVERIDSKNTEILSWWCKNKDVYALLFSVAQVILSIPGTQCSVEQLFSQVKFILNDLRGSLDSNNIQNIMIVRCNFSHLEHFFEKY